MNKSIIALSILASLCVLPVAHAAESALNTTPKIDAAIVPSGAGFATKAEENAIGMKGSHNEGIVIRGSYIENGKIVIPPAGLYYTNRGPRQYMLRGDALQMLGKMRYLANYDSYGAVVANKEFKPGETFRLTPNTLFKLQGISPKGNGHANPVASFVFVRPSGVLTGNKHSINASPDYPYVDTYKMPFTPTKLETGIYPIDANHRFDLNNFTSSFSQAPNTYVLADNLNEKSIMVLEAAMTAVDNVYVSDTKPISGWYKAGDTIPLGNYTAKVEKVDAAAGTATVSLTGKDGKKTEKVLGPMPMNLEKILISSTVEPVEVFMLKSPDKTAQVEISAYADGGFIKNDTVALNLHKDLYPLQLGKEWPSDPKFLYRPDH